MIVSPRKTLSFHGIDGESGEYLLAPRRADEMGSLLAAFTESAAPKRLGHGHAPNDLAAAGWAVIWREGGDPARRAALAPLLELRREQAGARFRELEAYPDETTLDFLARYGAGPGPVNPDRVPYHLLIAATPEEIPFEFQSELACTYSVGRLDLDSPDDDTTYARRLARFETEGVSPRTAALFGPEHRDDRPTWSSSEHLTQGLDRQLAGAHRNWSVATLLRHAATKTALHEMLHSERPPSLLFTAGHGLRYRKTSDFQATHQGSLLCAEYPGPKVWNGRPMPDEFMFAAGDLDESLDLSGLVTCHFACYSAGTPRFDRFADHEPKELADRPFVAPLAKALLARGALGVIGHVDVTMEGSFLWHDAGPQITAFESLLSAVLDGNRLGHAMEYMADRYAQLAVRVSAAVRRALVSGASPEGLLALAHWAAYEDARNFVLLGDPAGRLAP